MLTNSWRMVATLTVTAVLASGCTSSERKPVIVPAQPTKAPTSTAPAAQAVDVVPPTAGNGGSETVATVPSNGDVTPNAGGNGSEGTTVPNAVPAVDVTTPTSGPPTTQSSTSGLTLADGKTRLNALTFVPPSGFSVAQQAQTDGIVLVGLVKGTDYVNVYSRQATGLTTSTIFVNGAKITTPEATKHYGSYDWKVIETTKTVAAGLPHAGTVFVFGFLMEKAGISYYGYAKAQSAAAARADGEALLNAVTD